MAMPKLRSLLHGITGLALGLLMLAVPAAAQSDYPNRPVRLIIPFPPGGSNDVVGRLIGTQLTEKLGKQVVIDNRAGAGGVVGTELLSNAPNDGYTIGVVSIAHAVNPWLYKLPYDPKALAPVGLMATGTNVLVIHPSLPVRSVQELIALAKQKPGELQYASAGVGSFQHLGTELFKLEAGINLLHVPFRGGGPSMTSVLGGHNKIMMSSLVQTTPHIKSGRLIALATGGKQRSPILPDVPTVAESGVPGYEALNWWGIVAPQGTSPEIIAKLHRALSQVQDMPEVQKQFDAQGAAVQKMSSAEFGKFVDAELNRWQRVVKEAGIKAE
jgi:tripartite-type tricarboxylate transporter receptor subunit TctC